MNIKYPFQFDNSGHTAVTDVNSHIRELIEQVLFTIPGERVNRPTFGTNLMQLVFQPNSNELAATTQFMVQGALQQWLGDLIAVSDVNVENQDSTILVTVAYTVRSTQQSFITQFSS